MGLMSSLTMAESQALYEQVLKDNDLATMKKLCLEDLFFLMTVACRRGDMNREWVYARAREVEASPDGHIDLWSREHFKSSLITFGLTIQEILKDPEVTIAIFSHTRPIAKGFLIQIKRELEDNNFLKSLFPEILYADPSKESPRWSIDDGLIVKRKSNPKESTLEAWGLVDGQPTSKHYSLMVYDDVVTRDSVTSTEMINKVTECFGLSMNLESSSPDKPSRKRYIGTRYHQMDTYATIMQRGTAKPRIYPATHDGTETGEPVLMSKRQLAEKRRDMGPYIFNTQMLQNPSADKSMSFRNEWLMYYNVLKNYDGWNFYIIVDPAGEKKKTNDYTVMWVVGLAPDSNYYVVDGIRDRLNLTERTERLFGLVRRWKPKAVGYEKYGLMADIEHIRYVQEQEGYRFHVQELGGGLAKHDRIRKLVPIFEQGRIYFPRQLLFTTAEGRTEDIIAAFINEEYDSFPVSSHDDMLDCLARIIDESFGAVFPTTTQKQAIGIPVASAEYDPYNKPSGIGVSEQENIQATKTWKQLMTK